MSLLEPVTVSQSVSFTAVDSMICWSQLRSCATGGRFSLQVRHYDTENVRANYWVGTSGRISSDYNWCGQNSLRSWHTPASGATTESDGNGSGEIHLKPIGVNEGFRAGRS